MHQPGCYIAITAASADAATANFVLVFLAGDPLLPTAVVESTLATSLATLFAYVGLEGLGDMTATLLSKVIFCFCGPAGPGTASFVHSSVSLCSVVLRYILPNSLKPSMVAFSVPCFFIIKGIV